MRRRAFRDDTNLCESARPAGPTWRIRRVDIRAPLSRNPSHVARVELDHDERGRVTDVAAGPDALGAALEAVGHIVGCKASIISLHSCHRSCLTDENRDPATATIVIECDGRMRRGTASGQDLIYACLAAFVEAVTSDEERDVAVLSGGLNLDDDVDLIAARPYQATGLDENGDFWLFASDDEGAAEAIAMEFGQDEYRSVRLRLPGDRSSTKT